MGVRSTHGYSLLGKISDTVFAENKVTVAGYIQGGGLVGGRGDRTSGSLVINVRLDGLSNVTFADNTVKASHTQIISGGISGGGLVGADGNAAALMGNTSGTFVNNEVYTGIQGATEDGINCGGLIGVIGYVGTATLGTVSGTFANNTVSAGGRLRGGGLVGVYSDEAGTSFGGFDGVSITGNTVFSGTAAASKSAGGGVFGATGLDGEVLVKDAVITGNSYTANLLNNAGGGGIMYIGTDFSGSTASVLLTASNGKTTEFSGNTYTQNGVARASSFHFGRGYVKADRLLPESMVDASLTVRPETGGTVLLLDPVSVEMSNGKNFTMTVDASAGAVKLGGLNSFSLTGGGLSTMKFASGVTTLTSDYSLKAENGTTLAVSVDSSTTLAPALKDRPENPAHFDYSNAAAGSSFTVAAGAKLAPNLDGINTVTAGGTRWQFIDNLIPESIDNFELIQTTEAQLTLIKDTDNNSVLLQLAYTPQNVYGDSPNAVAITDIVNAHIADMPIPGETLTELLHSLRHMPQENNLASIQTSLDTHGGIAAVALHKSSAGTSPGAATQAASLHANLIGIAPMGQSSPLFSGTNTFQKEQGRATSTGMETGGFLAPQRFASPLARAYARELVSAEPGFVADTPGSRIWTGYYGNVAHQDKKGGYAGYTSTVHGVLLGLSHPFTSQWEAGLYGGRTHGNVSMRGHSGKVEQNGSHFGGYGRWSAPQGVAEGLHLTVDGLYSHVKNDAERRYMGATYAGNYVQDILSAGGEIAWDIPIAKSVTVTPYARTRYSRLHQNSSSDSGPDPWRMKLHSHSYDAASTQFGTDFTYTKANETGLISPTLSLAWQHDYGERACPPLHHLSGSRKPQLLKASNATPTRCLPEYLWTPCSAAKMATFSESRRHTTSNCAPHPPRTPSLPGWSGVFNACTLM